MLVNFLKISILPLGVFGVFSASVIEEVFAPIPSALIMTMSGFIFVSGSFGVGTITSLILKVAVPAALGVTFGSFLVYFVSKFGGRLAVEKWGKYLGLYWTDVEKLKNRFLNTKKDELIILIARVVPFVPSVAVSALCGILEMNYRTYFVLTFCGMFVRALILGAIGWQVGNLYEKYAHLVGKIESSVLYIILITLFIFFMVKFVNTNVWIKKQPK